MDAVRIANQYNYDSDALLDAFGYNGTADDDNFIGHSQDWDSETTILYFRDGSEIHISSELAIPKTY